MAKSYEELKRQAAVIKNETADGANTASRIGTMFEDTVDFLDANISQNKGFSVADYKGTPELTRLSIDAKYRVKGAIISYNPGTGYIMEQYIGTTLLDSEWQKGNNWLPYYADENIQNIAEYARSAGEQAVQIAQTARDEAMHTAQEAATEAKTQANYAKEQGDRLANIDLSLYRVVIELPSISEMSEQDMNKIYLKISVKQGETNKYDEYICVDGVWELLGQYEAAIDLTAYVGKDELSTEIASLPTLENISKFVCIDENGDIAGVMTKEDISSVLGIDTLKKNTSGLTSNGTVDVLNHYTSLAACFYANQYTDVKDGIPWYSIGFDSTSKPFISGYYGMTFRSANGKVIMDSDGRMTGPGFVQSSDRRLKSNIYTLGNLLDKINQLRPCSYTLNSDNKKTNRIGLIAQEVEEVFPQFVYTDKQGYKSIDYASMVSICIKAIQELYAN